MRFASDNLAAFPSSHWDKQETGPTLSSVPPAHNECSAHPFRPAGGQHRSLGLPGAQLLCTRLQQAGGGSSDLPVLVYRERVFGGVLKWRVLRRIRWALSAVASALERQGQEEL